MKRLLLIVLLTTASAQAADLYKTWKDLSNRRDVAALKTLVAAAALTATGCYSIGYAKSGARKLGRDTVNKWGVFEHGTIAAALGYTTFVIGLDHCWPNLCKALKI